MVPNIIDNLVELVYKLVTTITDSECVAVRLRSRNGEFPFHSGQGFDYNVQNKTCLKHFEEMDFDYRKCICGMVIRNKHEPIEEFFTKYGSFWNSDMGADFLRRLDSTLLVGKSCLTDGTKSLVVVPLKNKDFMEGVFHVSDSHSGKFKEEHIKRLEEISLYFTQIIVKIEETLSSSKSRKFNIVIADDEIAIGALIKNVLCRFGHVREKYDIYGPEIIVLSGYLNDIPDGFMKDYRVASVLSKPLDDIFEIPRVVEKVF